jgi:predicted dehydrogenase
MKRVRWGILSTAKIGIQKVIPAMQNARYTDVAAIASRDRGRAEQVSARLGIPRSYGSYDALLADPQIDAIYNPLPNHLHVEWSIKCLEAGKHVLCEKPIGLSVAEAEQLEAAGESYPRLKLMEAFMYRHHPQWIRAKQLVEDGAIGTLKTMHSFFSYHNVDPGNIRNQAEIGGGGLMDIGCYPISASRFIYGSEPRNVSASIEIDRTFQTDSYGSVALEFEGGTSTFSYSTQLAPYQRVNIFGTDGRIEIQIPFNAPPDRPCIINLQRGSEFEVIEFPVVDQYTLQAENMSLAILNDTPVATPVEDAVANMRVIERVFVSSRERSWA